MAIDWKAWDERRAAERGAREAEAAKESEAQGTTWTEDRMAELRSEMEDSETEETYTFDPEESRENFNAIGTLVTNTARDIGEAFSNPDLYEDENGEFPAGDEAAARARTNLILSPAKESAREFIAAYAGDNESRFQSMAQGLRRSGANLEYFMTPEEKTAMARRISQKFPQIPESALEGDTEAMQNALGAYDYASKLEAVGGDVNKVYEKYPVLKELADKGDTQGVTLALHDMQRVDEERDVVTAFRNGWRHGEDSYDYGVLKTKEAQGYATDEDKARIAELEISLKETEPYVPSFFVDPFVSMAAGGAESLPEMIYSTAKAVPYALPGAVMGGLAGSAAGGVGAVPGAIAGAKYGLRVGMANEMGRAMAGRKFAEYQAMTDENGNRLMTDAEAWERARVEGGLEAVVEVAGLEMGFLRNLSGGAATRKAVETIVKDGKNAIAAKTAEQFLAEAGKDLTVGVARETASEAVEEGVQSVVSDIFDADIARAKETGDMGFTLSGLADTMTEADWGDITKKAVAQGMEAVPGALFLGGVSSVGGVPMGGIRYGLESRAWRRQWGGMAKEERTTAAGTVMLEQLQATVHDSKLKDTAPDVQREILREELKETPWQMAYVDVETALKNENGLADVREAGKAAGLTDEEIKQAVEEKGTIAVPLECYAQSAASPELLDSVSFSPEAEPLAKIRENAKAAQEAYTKRMTAETQKQIELVEAMTKELFPEKREQDAAMAAIFQNPENPAQGWKELYDKAVADRDEILAPALAALDRGMGQGTSVIETMNEQGDVSTGRVSNNEEWYSKFYAEHKRQPNKEEKREMARKMMTGEADAPKVQGWTATDKETAALMENEKGRLAAAEEEIALLESVKERMQELNGAEMKLTEGMSPEAYKVYRTITTDLLKFGGKPGHAARVSALLWARHADVYAKRMRTKPGFENYTATDWLKDTIRGIVQGRAQGAGESYAQQEMTRQKEQVRAQYEGTDQWMKAPNGEKTNLTEDQWLTVRTDAFKNWFGDWENDPKNASKVVDENGEPKVVLHGTDRGGFSVFDMSRAGERTGKGYANSKIGAYFIDDYDYANSFADWGRAEKSQIYEVFLNIRNPLTDIWVSTYDTEEKLEELKKEIAEGNHDGIIDDLGEHVAFNPTQIKSATDNSGNFLIDDPNIYHQLAGENWDERLAGEMAADAEDIRQRLSQAVFDKYLNAGIMKAVRETVAGEIRQYVDIEKMSDPVERDKARDSLPYIKTWNVRFNQLQSIAKEKPEYLNRLAAKIEYARRCFDNDERIRNEIVRQMDGHEGQKGVYQPDDAALPGSEQRKSGSNGGRTGAITSSSISGEKRSARAHFEKLYNEMAQSRSENQGGFSDARILDILNQAAEQDGKKQAQFEIIQRENPMQDDIHTGIRSADEIKNAFEVFSEDTFEGINPDFTEADARKAMATGRIKVYSSKPIKNGGFVSTSRMMAKDYAGDGNIYEQEVSIDDVAWIDETEGQFAKVQGGFSFSQGNLGRTVSYSDGTRLVELFESADESTFLHESGHIFLMDLEHLAAMGDEESKADLALVEEWAAFRDGDEKKYRGTPWAREFAERARRIREAEKNGAAKMPDGTTKTKEELLREWKQERFARAFEMYLKEGKAPSKGLRGVFQKFCDFLKQVYMAVTSNGARASAQVEAVMGRLLATDEEIEAAAEDERYQDFMKAGGEKLLYEDAAETFSRWHEEAKEEARSKLRKIVMRSLTGKLARRRKEILREARVKKETELANQPVYLVRQAIEDIGASATDTARTAYGFATKEEWEKANAETPTMEEALDAYMRKYEADLDTKEVQEVLKEETIEKAMSSTRSHEKLLRMEQRAFARKAALADRLSGKPRRRMEDVERWIEEMPDDLDKDDMSTWHKAVTSLKLSNRWTKEELDAIDRLSVSASKEAAKKSFEALRKIIKERKVGLADLREANRGRVEALRKQAKETIRKQTLAQATQVATHRKAEKEAAKEAEKLAKQEKWAEAAAAKERELLAAFMATEAEKVRNRRDAILKHIRAQLGAKTKLPKDERYWHQHLAYLLRVADTDAAKPDGLKSLAEIAKALGDGLDVATDEDGRSDLLGLMEKLADENTRQDGYHGMKLEELEDAADVLTVLYTTGRDKFNLKLTKGKTIGEAVKEILEDKTAYNGAKVRQSTVTGNPNRGGVFWSETLSRIPGAGDALAKAAQRYGLSLTKPEELINLLGEKAHKYVYDTYDRAAEREAAMTADFVGKMEGILAKRYTPQEMREWQARKYDWRGQAVSKENILAMALNLGNEINMDRLVSGLQTNEAEITKFIADNMTEKDWLFCQDVWDLLHEYWPETVRVEMELNGTRLKPQEARAFNVKTKDKNGNDTEVKLRGGYYPIKYDPELSDKARETAENAEARASMSGAAVLGIGRGFTKDRAAKGAVKERPLLLSLSVIPEHVGEAVHNITTRIAARDVYRILNHADMKAYVNATLGMDAYNVLTTWATDVWKIKPEEGNGAAKVVNSVLRPIRQNAGIAIMGYRMWPTVENATNIFPMMDALGAAETLSAIKDYYGNKAEFDEMIAKSMFMRERTERMDRDMKGQRGMFEKKNAVSEWLVKHAYDPITFTDLLTSKPLWARAYKNAFPKMLEAVRQENEENAKTFAERRAEYDKINATILDMRKRRQEMEAELRRRARREAPQAETAYTRMSRTTLQDEIHILDGEIEDKGKTLFVAGEKMERASSLVIRTERETLDEATQRAVLAADKAVRDVIGSGDVKDLSDVQRSRNEAVKALTMFYSYFNTQANAIISAHWKGKWQGGAKYDFTPLAKAIAYRFLLTSLLSTVMRWALFGEGDDDKDKYKKDKEGHKVEVPALQRFLAQYAKNALSTTIGGAYGLREVGNQLINRLIEGRSYGARFDGMYGSLYDQTAKAAELIWMKRERDEKAREEEEKRQERYKNATPTQRKRMRQEERYRKPPNTISYADILRSVGDVGASLTAGITGATAPLVGAVLGTMQYLFDSDGRYDATLGNMMWSAFWTKKPVKKKPPEKPEKPKKEQKGR